LSEVVPQARDANPTPPPSARPPTATVGHEPCGIATPRAASVVITSKRSAPAPTVAVRLRMSTEIPFSRRKSTTTPFVVEYPP